MFQLSDKFNMNQNLPNIAAFFFVRPSQFQLQVTLDDVPKNQDPKKDQGNVNSDIYILFV